MKQAQTSIISFDRQGLTLHLSIVQKQSQTGLMYNQRLLILNQGHFFGYVSKFNIKDNPKAIDLQKIKYSVPIKYIKAIDHDKQNLIIKFLQIDETNRKQQQKKWVFKMTNSKMIQKWYQLLQEQKVRRANRSSQRKSKGKSSAQVSPKKNELFVGNNRNQSQQFQKKNSKDKIKAASQSQQVLPTFQNTKKQYKSPPKKRSSPKRQPTKSISQQQQNSQQYISQQNREFVNPLYTGYDSKDSQLSSNLIKKTNNKVLQTPKSKYLGAQQENIKNSNFNKKQTINQPKATDNNRQNYLMTNKQRSPGPTNQNLGNQEDQMILSKINHKNKNNTDKMNNNPNNNPKQGNADINSNDRRSPSPQTSTILAQKNKNQQNQNKNNPQFNKKSKNTYVQMIQKIMHQSQQKTIQKYKEKQRKSQNIGNNIGSQNSNIDQNSKILQQFLRYDVGETQKWRKQHLNEEAFNNQQQDPQQQNNQYRDHNKKQDSPQTKSKRYEQLQSVQQYVINLKKQQVKKISKNQPSENYKNFSKQIAQIIRNKRFQKDGHQSIKKNTMNFDRNKQRQALQLKWGIKHMPFTYRYMIIVLAQQAELKIRNSQQQKNGVSSQTSIQKQEDFMQLLSDWQNHCSSLMKQLITDIVTKQNKKFKSKGKVNNICYYQVQQIQIKLSFANMKTVHFNKNNIENGKDQKLSDMKNQNLDKKEEKISQYSAAKDLEIQFKNYNALFEMIHPIVGQTDSSKKGYQNNINSKFEVPLTALVEYYGFIALFKLNPKFSFLSKHQSSINEQLIKQKQSQITKLTHIDVRWLQSNNYNPNSSQSSTYNYGNISTKKTLILHIDQSYYNKLHVQRKKQYLSNKKKIDIDKLKTDYGVKKPFPAAISNEIQLQYKKLFNFDFLQQIDGFLLKDFLTKSLMFGVLRIELLKQMINRQQYKDIIFSNTIPNSNTVQLSKDSKNTAPKKSKNQANLTLLSGEVLQKLSYFILNLDSLSFYYLHPEQLSTHLHKQGINIRYIGLAYDNLTELYAKKFLMTEISCRVIKLLFRKTMQDIILDQQSNQAQKKANQVQQNINKSFSPTNKSPKTKSQNSKANVKTSKSTGQIDLAEDIIDFFNCIVGTSYQSNAMWKLLQKHALFYFKIKLNKQQIDPGYFIISLAYHCKLKINWKRLQNIHQKIFKRQEFFNKDNLLGLEAKAKTYLPILSPVYSKLSKNILESPGKTSSHVISPQNNQQLIYKSVINQLHLQRAPWPQHLTSLPMSSPLSILSIKQILSQHIRPESIKLSPEMNLSHLHIYQHLQPYPQKKSFFIKIAQLKWYLRLRKRQKYIKKFQQLSSVINNFYGDYCPILSQIYNIFANFHLQNGQYQDSITFSKSSIVNILKICGTNHLKTAQSYYNLSLCYLKSNKIQQAYSLLKKAKAIYEAKQKTSSQAYASILLKLSLLLLNKGQINQCIKQTQKLLQIYDQLIEEKQDQEQDEGISKNKHSQLSQLPSFFQNQKTQCFQTLYRCYLLLVQKQKKQNDYKISNQKQQTKKQIKLLINLSSKISQNFLYKIKSPPNLQKVIKILLHTHINNLISEQDSTQYIDLISSLYGITLANLRQISPKIYHKSFKLIKKRIKQNSFVSSIQNYIQNFSQINDFITLNNVLSQKNWMSFQKQYQRQTVNDFISFTEELTCFIGQAYLVGVLRDVTCKDKQLFQS